MGGGPSARAPRVVVDDDPTVLIGHDPDVVCTIGASLAFTLLRAAGQDFDDVVHDLFTSGMKGKALYAEMLAVWPRIGDRIFVRSQITADEAREFLVAIRELRRPGL